MATLKEHGNAIIDAIDGRSLLVCLDPESKIPLAFYTHARLITRQGKRFLLNTGEYLEDGIFFHAQGQILQIERPVQMYTRWYGFSYSFPDGEVSGEAEAAGQQMAALEVA